VLPHSFLSLPFTPEDVETVNEAREPAEEGQYAVYDNVSAAALEHKDAEAGYCSGVSAGYGINDVVGEGTEEGRENDQEAGGIIVKSHV